jgi:MFS transporter, DHA2 family, multidrug resistance protein
MGNATGIYNLMRNLGGSLGIALVSTLLVRRAQVHQALMVSHLTPFDPAYVDRLAGATAALTPESGPVAAQMQAQGLIYNTLQGQASLWAFVENFRIFGLLCLCCLPLILLFRKLRKGARPPAGSH